MNLSGKIKSFLILLQLITQGKICCLGNPYDFGIEIESFNYQFFCRFNFFLLNCTTCYRNFCDSSSGNSESF